MEYWQLKKIAKIFEAGRESACKEINEWYKNTGREQCPELS
jgi:hypothetical protein